MSLHESTSNISPEIALSQLDKILIPGNRGFCAGVDRAIEMLWAAHTLNRQIDSDAVTYCIHPIVHNSIVTAAFEERGVQFVERFDQEIIPAGSMIVFSAHGRPFEEIAKAQKLGYRVFDAMCPLVLKVHKQVDFYTRQGYLIIYLGVNGHRETEGILGVAPTNTYLVDMKSDEREQNAVNLLLDLKKQGREKFAVLTQTTLSQHETHRVKKILKETDENILLVEDLCFATTNRQDAVIDGIRRLKADHVIAVGDPTSKNTAMLTVTAENEGVSSQRINTVDELNLLKLLGKKRVIITSGASVPESQLMRVINWFRMVTKNRVKVDFLDELRVEDKGFGLPEDLKEIWESCKSTNNIPNL